MPRWIRLLPAAVLIFLQMPAHAQDFDSRTAAFARGLLRKSERTLSRGVSPGTREVDDALRDLTIASGAEKGAEVAQSLLNLAERKAAEALALAQAGNYEKARTAAREADRIARSAQVRERALTHFKATVERNLEKAPKSRDLDFSFLSTALSSFQTSYIDPIKTKISDVFGMIDTVYETAKKIQKGEWARASAVYLSDQGILVPAVFYNVSFDDLLAGDTKQSEATVGTLGEVIVKTTERDEPKVSKLSLQVGISASEESTGKGGDSRIGFLGAGYQMTPMIGLSIGGAAGSSRGGAEPYAGVSVSLFRF